MLKAAGAASLLGLGSVAKSYPVKHTLPFLDILRLPDLVRAFGPDDHEIVLERTGDRWGGGGVELGFKTGEHSSSVTMTGEGVCRLQLRWRGDFSRVTHYLGDHWERSYADLSWQGESPNRILPWYFLASDGQTAHGYGVKTGAGAMCFWMADSEGISLWADVRSGGSPVELGGRTLSVAEIVCRKGGVEGPFAAAKALCHLMSEKPLLTELPTYGTNDWNFAYGNNSAELIASVSALISELSDSTANRPYSVIDEGWAMGPYNGNFGHGPWVGNPRFGDMAAFAERLKGLGVRPGIWFRPLTPLPDSPDSWRLSRDHSYLDPTIPEVIEHVEQEIAKLSGWGYELIKHDFSTWDFTGRWGSQMGPSPTEDGWKPHDASRTTAEILTNLYHSIRKAAGTTRLLGCNTVGHLTAGTHELQRIGDDTSGRSWNRNRRMGVNTMAFRGVQHRTFFEVDPDIVSITKNVPWELVDQWLRLVSEGGASLFVAIDPSITEPKHRVALKKAFELAAVQQPIGEPLDWLDSLCPRRWKLQNKEVEFAWMGESGAWPFSD